ncbi:MAG: hypothetical protein ACK5O7_04965 [Holosporales bacterium]
MSMERFLTLCLMTSALALSPHAYAQTTNAEEPEATVEKAEQAEEKASEAEITQKVQKNYQVALVEKRHSSLKTCPNILELLKGTVIGASGAEKTKTGMEKLANPKYALVTFSKTAPHVRPYAREAQHKFALVRLQHEGHPVLYAVRYANPTEGEKIKLDLDKLKQDSSQMIQTFNNDACVLSIKNPQGPMGRKELVWLYHVVPVENTN